MTVFFVDVSHYQGDYHPTGPTFAKATQGIGETDPTYATNRDRTRAGGWLFAAYHYLTTDDPGAQARHAYAVVGPDVPLMVDVEKGSGSLAHLLAFVAAYRKLGGLVTLAYIPHWYWQGSWGSPSLKPVADAGLALISSDYTAYSDTGPGWAPYGGMTPAIWQYTSTPIDRDAFRGTLSDLMHLVNPSTPGDIVSSPLTTGNVGPAVVDAPGEIPTIASDPDHATLPKTTLATAVYRLRQAVDHEATDAQVTALAAAVADLAEHTEASLAALAGQVGQVLALLKAPVVTVSGVTPAQLAASDRAAANVLDPQGSA